MAFTIKSHILFEVNIWHHYFLDKEKQNFLTMKPDLQLKQLQGYNSSRFLEIIPTQSTLQYLRDNQLLWIQTPTGMLCAVKNTEGDRPAIVPDENTRLTFELRVADTEFPLYTDVEWCENPNGIHYFNNLYEPLTPHLIDLNKMTTSGVGSPLYVDKMTWLQRYEPVFPFELESGTAATASVYDNCQKDKPLVLQQTLLPLSEKAVRQIDLRSLISGWYQLSISDNSNGNTLKEASFYLNKDGFRRNTFGVIDIWCRKGEDSFAVLNKDGSFKKPSEGDTAKPACFEVRLKNRKVVWHYVFADNSQYRTKDERPITTTGYIEVDYGGKKLPNPTARHIKVYLEEKKPPIYFAEIFQP